MRAVYRVLVRQMIDPSLHNALHVNNLLKHKKNNVTHDDLIWNRPAFVKYFIPLNALYFYIIKKSINVYKIKLHTSPYMSNLLTLSPDIVTNGTLKSTYTHKSKIT